jgi:hypothetical protein
MVELFMAVDKMLESSYAELLDLRSVLETITGKIYSGSRWRGTF